MKRGVSSAAFAVCLATLASSSFASCGWSRIDRQWNYDASGVWNPNAYRTLMATLAVADIGGALWEGSDSRLGKALWQGIDSAVISSVAEAAGKRIFTRARPGSGSDPCMWFKGGSNYSFPSGEAAVAAGLVAPLVFEYAHDNPIAYSLLLLPAYVGVARIKNQAHWQSDVIAGWAVGGISGWYSHTRDTPFSVMILPRGITVGFRKQF
jgi:undecaprenyl-diphosphatase